MDRDDVELLERSLRHATATHTGDSLDAALAELGWADALAVDARAAVSILFACQGSETATSSALDRVVLHALALDTEPATGVVLPAVGRWDPPATVVGDDLHLDGVATGAGWPRPQVLVVADAGDGTMLAATVPTSSLTTQAVQGVDPDLGLLRVTGTVAGAATAAAVPTDRWTSAVALARLALAHELVGVSRTMLALAREHALERVQFGRPISSFQAIRHRLAETLVAIEAAEAVLDAAWLDGSPGSAAMAKAMAGRGARTAARHCQQVLAGIGFTTEHALHRSIRRALVLDVLLGTSSSLTKHLGEELVASRRLPPLLPL